MKIALARKPKRFGASNPLWKGQNYRYKSHGYVYVRAPEGYPYPDNVKRHRMIREHILVWEQTNNKPLPKGDIVHHFNGIKDDNRPENLIALPRRNHHSKLLLNALNKHVSELEIEIRELQQVIKERGWKL
jgi:hypothetical protein